MFTGKNTFMLSVPVIVLKVIRNIVFCAILFTPLADLVFLWWGLLFKGVKRRSEKTIGLMVRMFLLAPLINTFNEDFKTTSFSYF
jgi:hypothetical protein